MQDPCNNNFYKVLRLTQNHAVLSSHWGNVRYSCTKLDITNKNHIKLFTSVSTDSSNFVEIQIILSFLS